MVEHSFPSSKKWISAKQFEDFLKFLKCCIFYKNSRKSTENVCEQWDITETNNWIWLLIFDDNN